MAAAPRSPGRVSTRVPCADHGALSTKQGQRRGTQPCVPGLPWAHTLPAAAPTEAAGPAPHRQRWLAQGSKLPLKGFGVNESEL